MSGAPLPFASIQNDLLRLDYLTTTGPRIIGLYAKSVEGNLLAETPEVHWPTPHGEFYLRGGHRLWVSPEDERFICPEEDLQVIEDSGKIILRSPVDACSIEKEISIQLDNNCVHLSHRVTWHGNETMELASWGITQLRLGGMGILPLAHVDGLLPDRNLVLWPYTKLNDERLELHDDMILLRGTGSDHACKIGNFNSAGWTACAMGDVLFTKRFHTDANACYPDLNCNVEAYVQNTCIELENLGPLKKLTKGDSVAHNETWQVTPGNFPATLETARLISRQHQKHQGVFNG
jgi:hypothetical protein